MDELIERLRLKRDVWRGTEFGDDFCELLDEAADTLEALRAERDLFRDETIELVRQNGEWQTRAERLAEALRNSADALERLAFAIRAPNAHTPQLVELAIAMRAAANQPQEGKSNA